MTHNSDARLIPRLAGMSPLTYYLSFSKLAPVQVQFSHGHPITSGNLHMIDYFVTSDKFRLDREINHGGVLIRDEMGHEELGSVAKEVANYMGRNVESVYEYGSDAYVEQVVYFDSLTASIPPPPPLPASSASLPSPLDPNLHYYALLQYSKKIHPLLDAAILGIVRGDEGGRVLMLEGSRAHISRWRRDGWSDEEIERVIFVGRMGRTDFLTLISHCSCALGTFPWGEGVTTFEAFAVNVPTVILPSMVTVENLSLGQVRALGLEEELMASLLKQHPKYLPSLKKMTRITGATSDPYIADEVMAHLRRGLEETHTGTRSPTCRSACPIPRLLMRRCISPGPRILLMRGSARVRCSCIARPASAARRR